MARFFFNLRNGRTVRDREGTDFPTAAAAREAAVEGIRRTTSQLSAGGRFVSLSHQLEVQDEDGETITTIPFWEAMRLGDFQ